MGKGIVLKQCVFLVIVCLIANMSGPLYAGNYFVNANASDNNHEISLGYKFKFGPEDKVGEKADPLAEFKQEDTEGWGTGVGLIVLGVALVVAVVLVVNKADDIADRAENKIDEVQENVDEKYEDLKEEYEETKDEVKEEIDETREEIEDEIEEQKEEVRDEYDEHEDD